MARSRSRSSRPNNYYNKQKGTRTEKNGSVGEEISTSIAPPHTDRVSGTQQRGKKEGKRLDETTTTTTTTMTKTMTGKSPATPQRGKNKEGKGSDDSTTGIVGDKDGKTTPLATTMATTMTTTTTIPSKEAIVARLTDVTAGTIAIGRLPTTPKRASRDTGSPADDFNRRDYSSKFDGKRQPDRPPGQGETPEAKKSTGDKEASVTKLFPGRRSTRIAELNGGKINVGQLVSALKDCYFHPFYTKDVVFYGGFGFCFWLEALSQHVATDDPEVAYLLANVMAPEYVSLSSEVNERLYRLITQKGRFGAGEALTHILQLRETHDGVSLLWKLFQHFDVPGSLDWALAQLALDAEEAVSRQKLHVWSGESQKFKAWRLPVQTWMTANIFQPLQEQEPDAVRHLASQWALYTLLRTTLRAGKAAATLAKHTHRTCYMLFQEMLFADRDEADALALPPNLETMDVFESEDAATVVAGAELTTESQVLEPRRRYNHRYKLTVTGTGHDQRSKGFAFVVEAISQMLVDIKEVTHSQPVLRPWRLSNKDSPAICDAKRVPKSEAGMAPYLFDRFWDKPSGQYYAEGFLGFDTKPPVELAALTQPEGTSRDQLPYFLTDRAIQEDSIDSAGWLLGSTHVTDQERLRRVLAEAVQPLAIDVVRRRIPVPGENPLKQKMVFALRIFASATQKTEVAQRLTDLYPYDGEMRGLDGKSFVFIPDASFYASAKSVVSYEKLRERQEKLERRLRTEIMAEVKPECLDTELDRDGNTLRTFLQSLLGPGGSKEKYLIHNIDIHDNVVKLQCFPKHHKAVTTICSSLLTYLEHILRNHGQGEEKEQFVQKLRKCFTATARDFARRCTWNEESQTMETPADNQMERIMKAVEGRFTFDLSEMEAAPKSGIRTRQETDDSTMTTQASLGLDMNCFKGPALDKAMVARDSIPNNVNVLEEGERSLKKPRGADTTGEVVAPSAAEPEEIFAQQMGSVALTASEVSGGRETKGGGRGGNDAYMAREMDKLRDIVKCLQTELQGGRVREQALQEEIGRLTTKLAGVTMATQNNSAARQPAVLTEDLDDGTMEDPFGLDTARTVGNSNPSSLAAMDTGTPTEGPGATA